MNPITLIRLVQKDLELFRTYLKFYILGLIASLLLASVPFVSTFYLGCLLILTLLIGLGVHIAISVIVEEKQNRTRLFVLSWPVTPAEYFCGKLLAGLFLFLIPWGVTLLGMWSLVLSLSWLPNGILPFFTVTLLELLTTTCVLLFLALKFETTSWVITTMVANNIFLNLFLAGFPKMSGIASKLGEDVIEWSGVLIYAVLIELLIVAMAIAASTLLHHTKQDLVR